MLFTKSKTKFKVIVSDVLFDNTKNILKAPGLTKVLRSLRKKSN